MMKSKTQSPAEGFKKAWDLYLEGLSHSAQANFQSPEFVKLACMGLDMVSRNKELWDKSLSDLAPWTAFVPREDFENLAARVAALEKRLNPKPHGRREASKRPR